MRLGFFISFYFGLRVLPLFVGLSSAALAQSDDFARKRCVEVGFPAGTAGHADCVTRYLESAGRGKPTVPKPTSPLAEPKPKIEADIAIEKQKKKEALERKEE